LAAKVFVSSKNHHNSEIAGQSNGCQKILF